MSKLIGLVVAASALIVLISAGLLYASDQEKLEQELNEAAERGPDEVEKILKTVPEGERDNVKVDGLSFNQILSLGDTSCGLEDLGIVHGIINDRFALRNRGVSKFVNSHIAQRKKSCGQNFHSILQGAVQEFQTDDLKKVKALHSIRWIYGIERSAIKAAMNQVEDKRFPMCVRIIKKLSVPMRFDGWKTEIFDKKQLNFINHWYNWLETCKRYTEKRCRLDMRSRRQYWTTSLQDDCKAIEYIGRSDKRIKELKNSKPPKYKSSKMTGQGGHSSYESSSLMSGSIGFL